MAVDTLGSPILGIENVSHEYKVRGLIFFSRGKQAQKAIPNGRREFQKYFEQ